MRARLHPPHVVLAEEIHHVLADAAAGVRTSFLTVGIWWVLFTVPAMLFVREVRPAVRPGALRAMRDGVTELLATLQEFIDAQGTPRSPRCGQAQWLQVQRLLSAAERSLSTRQSVSLVEGP